MAATITRTVLLFSTEEKKEFDLEGREDCSIVDDNSDRFDGERKREKVKYGRRDNEVRGKFLRLNFQLNFPSRIKF